MKKIFFAILLSVVLIFIGGQIIYWNGDNPIDAQTVYRATISPSGNGNYTLIYN